MSERTVYACDFCKREDDCKRVPLPGGERFDVCEKCFYERGLEPLLAAAQRALNVTNERNRQGQWQQYAQAASIAGLGKG